MITPRRSGALLLLAFAIPVLIAGQARAEDAYDDPRRLMNAFCRCLGEGDFDAAARLFDATAPVWVNPAAETPWTRVLDREALTQLGNYPAYAWLNEEAERIRYLTQIRFFVTSLLGSEKYPQMAALRPQMLAASAFNRSEESLAQTRSALGALSETFDPARMKNLSVARMDRVRPEGVTDEAFADTLEVLRDVFGIEDVGEYLLLYELDGAHYLGGATLQKHGGGWHIGALLALSQSEVFRKHDGFLPKITAAEYEALVSGAGEERP